MDAPDALMSQRYGQSRPRLRLAVSVVLGLLAAVFVAWVLWAAVFHATPQVQSRLIGFRIVEDHRALATVEVTFADDVEAADCRIRALAADHATVGSLVFTPTGGQQQVSLRTARRATAIELIGCTTAEQERPR